MMMETLMMQTKRMKMLEMKGTRKKKKEEEEKDNNNEEEESKKSKSVYVANLTWWTSDKQNRTVGERIRHHEIHPILHGKRKTGNRKDARSWEFTSSQSALLCAENLNKRAIDGKACVVTLAPVVYRSTRRAAGIGGSTMMMPRAPLGPPPDTAWKGPVPTKGGGGQGAPPVSDCRRRRRS